MLRTLDALSKQLFGTRYERIAGSAAACILLFLALTASGFRVAIAPSVLFLTVSVFTAGVMWRELSSCLNAERLMGFFLLPFDNLQFVFSYVTAFGAYTLLTKTSLVLAVFFAVARWSALQVLISLFCAVGACFLSAVCYSAAAGGRLRLQHAVLRTAAAVTAGSAAVMAGRVFRIRADLLAAGLAAIGLCSSTYYLFSAPAYVFYRPVSAKTVFRHAAKNGSILVYLLRYLMTNKSYLINLCGLWGAACLLPRLFGGFEGLDLLPLGFAVLCLNTPVCILLSSDSDLEQAVRTLPGQAVRFCSRYCLFLFLINLAADGIYLLSWRLLNGVFRPVRIPQAAFFALLSAVLSVLLEWLRPIRGWKTEADLWHHPRKYLVPLIMMLIAVLVST